MKKILLRALRAVLIFLFGRKRLVFLLANNREKRLLGFENGGYLHDIGWVQSVDTKSVVDVNHKPVPWVTYPFISFIADRLKNDFELFEFGSGNSTLYYASKVASVESVENDRFWFEKIKTNLPQNSSLFFCNLEYNGEYCRYAQKTGKQYDVIVVDGRDRVNCCKNGIGALKPGGVLVLDDSEREQYAEGIDFLKNEGFRKIDFWGLAPMVNYLKCTTVFYRANNCLGI